MMSIKRKVIIITAAVPVVITSLIISRYHFQPLSSTNERKSNDQKELNFIVSKNSETGERSGTNIERELNHPHPRELNHPHPRELNHPYPRIIILWTTWRSGSTYTGELLAKALPQTFFSTEPLHWIGVKILHQNSNETSRARTFLQDLLHCRLGSSYKSQVTYMSQQLFYQRGNRYLMKNCRHKQSCDDPLHVSEMCREANMHVGKVIRLPLRWAWSLLQDDELDLQIIYLVRDPRATLASRAHVQFCYDTTCNDPKKVCELLEDDLMIATKMQQTFPQRFKLIQYEQFNRDAERGLRDLMSFIGFPSLSQMQLDLLHPKTLNPNDPFATNKNSSMMIDRWRTNTSFKNVRDVQEACAKPISMLGLRDFHSVSEFRNLSLPLVMSYPVQQ